ncbi:MAG: hypothetical protein A2583_08215 [Bdellovibrionales bacterium RIFOXYD1_FULL_53_11]|nr:MAG: hypothetical protein A2583_08215 [Bdellovibrionales bacterium RIFOXYD1_FULL_53_11]
MNAIRSLRFRVGITQQALASRSGTSQSTIAMYESGAKSPTMKTFERLAASVDLDVISEFTPRMTREDRRSLAYHDAIAEVLRKKPGPAIARAERNLKKMTGIHHNANALLCRWSLWLTLPSSELARLLLDPGLMARDMRQVSPFAGILSADDRAKILKRFRREQKT